MGTTDQRLDRIEADLRDLHAGQERLEDDMNRRLGALEQAAAARAEAATQTAVRLSALETLARQIDGRVYAMLLAVIALLVGVVADLTLRLLPP